MDAKFFWCVFFHNIPRVTYIFIPSKQLEYKVTNQIIVGIRQI